MHAQFLLDRFRERQSFDAIIWRGQTTSYRELLSEIEKATTLLETSHVKPGSVVSLEADFTPTAIALLFSLIQRKCIVVPLNRNNTIRNLEVCAIAEVGTRIYVDDHEGTEIVCSDITPTNQLLINLQISGNPGLIVFTSGSTGQPKAIVHDFSRVLTKFSLKRVSKRMICFLLFDHMGGINTLLHILSSNGCAILTDDRSPESVALMIEKYRVEILPTSPTFLNLFILSESYKNHDLSSLEVITYGTEPMALQTLQKLREIVPRTRLLQTYGLSEFGVMRTVSKDSDSLWVKVGGDGYNLRVTDGLLEIKSETAMLGYMNAPSPFDSEGWFKTGDEVEVDGEFVKILGRKSEMINVA